MLSIKIISESKVEPLALEEVKKYMRVQSSYDDDLLLQLIATARQYAEHYMRIALISKDIEVINQGGIEEVVRLPFPPVLSIFKVTETDAHGNATEVDPALYTLQHDLLHINLPSAQSVNIFYNAGYDVVPSAIKTGMLRHVFVSYSHRASHGTDRGAQSELLRIAREIYKKYAIFDIA